MFADPDAAYVLGFSVRALNELTLTLLTPTLTLTPTLARPSPKPKPDPKPNPTHTPRGVIMLSTLCCLAITPPCISPLYLAR